MQQTVKVKKKVGLKKYTYCYGWLLQLRNTHTGATGLLFKRQ